MRSRARRVRIALLVALATAGCGGLIPAAGVGDPPFPECSADAYAFIGDASLADIGLADMWREEAGRVGEIWVTAGPPTGGDWGPPGAPPMEQRVICLEFDDGSGMAGPIDDDWQPPGARAVDWDPRANGSPLAALVVGLAALVIVIVSYLAFRGRVTGRDEGQT